MIRSLLFLFPIAGIRLHARRSNRAGGRHALSYSISTLTSALVIRGISFMGLLK